jgi:hypothetical protein
MGALGKAEVLSLPRDQQSVPEASILKKYS